MRSSSDGVRTQVLGFRLGEERYCVDIAYVAEIVDGGEVTSVPKSGAHVEGVMDLRGRTTTIVDPSTVLDVDGVRLAADGGTVRNRIVVLDPDAVDVEGTVGWLVSDVEEVTAVPESEVEVDATDGSDVVRGLVRDGDGFVVWLDPNELLA